MRGTSHATPCLTTLHNVHYRRLAAALEARKAADDVPSRESWRISKVEMTRGLSTPHLGTRKMQAESSRLGRLTHFNTCAILHLCSI